MNIRYALTSTLDAFLALFVGCLFGCAEPHQAYQGTRLEPSNVARISAYRGRLVQLDGVEIFEKSIEVLPGAHSLVSTFAISTKDLGFPVSDDYHGKLVCKINFNANPGTEYEIFRSDPAGDDQRGIVTRMYHVVTLREINSGNNVARGRCRWKR